jgi:hypothetical protein
MDKVRDHFNMHEEVDEEKTILLLDDETKIEKVTGSYDPMEDEVAKVRVILVDPSLRLQLRFRRALQREKIVLE